MAGTIYLVATPIGNLEDITLRALRILREADVIACEDTRHTRKLLTHFDIQKPVVSYHEHNEAHRAAELVQRAQVGQAVAVVTDAGTPGISDPGFRVVRAAIEASVPVVSIPGPVAAVAALASSGLPADSFHFAGFLPAKKGQRRKALEALADIEATLVFYEAPHRIIATLDEVRGVLGDRPIVVARELTKIHEECLRGSIAEVVAELKSRKAIKGEMTILVGRGETGSVAKAAGSEEPLAARVGMLMADEGLSRMEAIKRAARERGISKREAYALVEADRGARDDE